MAYQDTTQRRDKKYTIRMKPEHGQLMEMLAQITGTQTATVIHNMAIQAAKQEIARFANNTGGGKAVNT